MWTDNLAALVGKTVTFEYNKVERSVEVESVKECKNGQTLIVGKDVNKQMAYRSFDVLKMVNLTVFPVGWDKL